jgi:ABC-type nickel/cobalt efflux system permease component RcnA
MLIIGLVLILAAALVGFGAVYDGGEAATVEVFGVSVDTTVGGVFLAGAATMLVLLLGLWLLTSSMGRARRKRAERKEIKRRHRDSVARLEEERTQLRAENERLNERLGTTGGTAADSDPVSGTTGTGQVTGADGSDTHGSQTYDTTGTNHERGLHARQETDVRDADRTATGRPRDGQL